MERELMIKVPMKGQKLDYFWQTNIQCLFQDWEFIVFCGRRGKKDLRSQISDLRKTLKL